MNQIKLLLIPLLWIMTAVTSSASLAEEVTYLVPGNKGVPTIAFDENGEKVWDQAKEPFGRLDFENTAFPLGPDNYLKDEETQLAYSGSRYYDPALTRFNQFDLGAIDTGNPANWNRYQFNNNNPATYLDPDGNVAFVLVGILVYKGAMLAWDAYDIYRTANDESLSAAEKTALVGATVVSNADPTGISKLIVKGKRVYRGLRTIGKSAEGLADFAQNYRRSAGAAQRIPSVLQTGGNKIRNRTANLLNEHLGMDLKPRDWGRAVEGMKKDLGLRPDHHGRILDNGDYINDAGEIMGNILDYVP